MNWHKPVALLALGLVVFGVVLTTRAQDDAAAESAATTYDFKDPKGVNGIGFFVNSMIEPFIGTGSGITGEVTYDPADPESFTGSISVDATTLSVTNPTMTEHMRGEGWLGVENHPKITMTFDEVTEVKEGEMGDKLLTVNGTLQALGLSLDKTVEISVSLIPDGAEMRGGGKTGDLLVLRSNFVVTRKDLGLKPDMSAEKVGNEVGVVVGIVGYEK